MINGGPPATKPTLPTLESGIMKKEPLKPHIDHPLQQLAKIGGG